MRKLEARGEWSAESKLRLTQATPLAWNSAPGQGPWSHQARIPHTRQIQTAQLPKSAFSETNAVCRSDLQTTRLTMDTWQRQDFISTDTASQRRKLLEGRNEDGCPAKDELCSRKPICWKSIIQILALKGRGSVSQSLTWSNVQLKQTNKKVQFLSGMVTHTCNLAFGRPRRRISGRGSGRGLESLPPSAGSRFKAADRQIAVLLTF